MAVVIMTQALHTTRMSRIRSLMQSTSAGILEASTVGDFKMLITAMTAPRRTPASTSWHRRSRPPAMIIIVWCVTLILTPRTIGRSLRVHLKNVG